MIFFLSILLSRAWHLTFLHVFHMMYAHIFLSTTLCNVLSYNSWWSLGYDSLQNLPLNVSSFFPRFGFSKVSVLLFLPISLCRRTVRVESEQWESSHLLEKIGVCKSSIKTLPLPVCFLKYVLKRTWELFPVGYDREVCIYNYLLIFHSELQHCIANKNLLLAASAAFSSSHPSQI